MTSYGQAEAWTMARGPVGHGIVRDGLRPNHNIMAGHSARHNFTKGQGTMTGIKEQEQRSGDYEFARDILRYAIELAREWDGDNVLSLVQEGLYLAHFEVTGELGDMRDELIELGLAPEELGTEEQAGEDECEG